MQAITTNGHYRSAYVLGAATVLAGVLMWSGLSAPRVAYAQVPDSGSQRNEMIKELRTSNQKLTEIAGLLREIRDAQAPDKDKKDKDRRPAGENP